MGALTFEPAAHEYRLDGKLIPSVSDVLEPLQQLDGIPPLILERARVLGQHGHSACALMVHKMLDWAKLDPVLVGYVSAAKLFLEEAEVRVLAVEHRMADDGLKFAGTLDVLGIMKRLTCVFDWKFTETMPRTAGPQTAAYDHLYRRNFGGRPMRRYGVQLFADGTYKIFPFEDTRDWTWFVSALNIWHWRNAA